jgi:hypothetical protein
MCSKYVYTFDQLWRANDVIVDMLFSLSLRPKTPGLVCVQVHHGVSSMRQIEAKYNWEVYKFSTSPVLSTSPCTYHGRLSHGK